MDVLPPSSTPSFRPLKRTIIAAVCAVILIFCIYFAWHTNAEYQAAIYGGELQGKAYARVLKEHAERTFGEADSILVAAREHLHPIGALSRQSPGILQKGLKEISGRSPQIGSLLLVNKQGLLYAHSLENTSKQADVSDRDYFKHHRDNPGDDAPYISRPVKSRINGKWRFTISRVLLDGRGDFAGLIAAAIEMDYFQKFYSSLNLGPQDRIQLIRSDGALLISEPFDEKKFVVDFSKSHLMRIHLPRSTQGTFKLDRGQGLLEPDSRIITYETLATYPVVAIVGLSRDQLVKRWQKLATQQGALFLLAVGSLTLLTIILIRQLRRIEAAHGERSAQQQVITAAATAWRSTFDALEDAIWVMDMDRRITRCNRAATRLFGMGHEQMINQHCCDVAHKRSTPLAECPFGIMQATRQRATMELQAEDHWYRIAVDPIFAADGSLAGAVHIMSDITASKIADLERELLEQKLMQSQKMEAVGHLAGGIAHDFNNLLTPIMGYAEMAVAEVPAASTLAKRLAGILTAAHRAKGLTQQLLSFSRSKATHSELLDLNEVILAINDLLHRTIRENIRIELGLDPDGSLIMGDRTQIEQIIINLTVNAQDAMEQRPGTIRLETCRVWMEGENARLHPGMIPGEYVLFAFNDNGCGIPEEVLEHIFEPFYTTKPTGHGTGLGLSTVYGIVKQHDAFIGVTSRPGAGTTFSIYFPVAAQQQPTAVDFAPQAIGRRLGEGTVMLVEDNEMTRNVVQEMLTQMGYAVIAATNPQHALELAAADSRPIDLLISDVVMPGMNGPELYEKLILMLPGLKVVFISGYPLNPALRGGTVEDETNYLQKPFTAEALLERIRQVL